VPYDRGLLVVAAVLALLYLFSGGIKVVRSKDQLRPMMEWVDIMPMVSFEPSVCLRCLGRSD
jgi:hypothetical protein